MRGSRLESGRRRYKDRTQERRAEKRSGAGRFTQGREWVGLNLLESPGVEGDVGLPGAISRGGLR
jgi:hypothetical protein